MRSRNARASAAPLRGGWRSALEQEGRGGEAAAPALPPRPMGSAEVRVLHNPEHQIHQNILAQAPSSKECGEGGCVEKARFRNLCEKERFLSPVIKL